MSSMVLGNRFALVRFFALRHERTAVPLTYSRSRFKDTLLKSTPRFKDTKNTRNMVPRRCEKSRGGPLFHHTGPPKIAVAHL